MEKPLAQAAGLGWQGKHTNLLSRDFGNWVFLGAIFTTRGAAARRAGGGALRLLHALPRHLPDRCLSGAVPAGCAALHLLPDDRASRAGGRGAAARGWATGSTAATIAWRSAPGTSSPSRRGDMRYPRGTTARAAAGGAGARWTMRGSGRGSPGSPIKRIGRDRFVRNVCYAIGNSGQPALDRRCRRYVEDADPAVADAARWAVERLWRSS